MSKQINIEVMHSALTVALQSPSAYWGVKFAIGHSSCIGKTMTQVAGEIGVTRASISKHAVDFCNQNNLPASSYMKDAVKTKKA